MGERMPHIPRGHGCATSEGLVCLKPDNDLVVPVDVARSVGQHGQGIFGIHVESAPLHFLAKMRLQRRPDFPGALLQGRKGVGAAAIRRGVGDNEPPNVDLGLPLAGIEPAPGFTDGRDCSNHVAGIHAPRFLFRDTVSNARRCRQYVAVTWMNLGPIGPARVDFDQRLLSHYSSRLKMQSTAG
jgi:hypothetical protein